MGTINGAGSYGFMLTVIDGRANGGGGMDKLRLKIWDGNGVIYDTQPGAADTAVPTTTLGGGSIVIHGGKAGGKGVNAADVAAPATPIDEDAPANRLFLPTIIR